jgi:hypothetical protein
VKATIELHPQTLNRVAPCDHESETEGCKAHVYGGHIEEGGTGETTFDPSRCDNKVRSEIALTIGFDGRVFVTSEGDEHRYYLSQGDLVELGHFMSVINDYRTVNDAGRLG